MPQFFKQNCLNLSFFQNLNDKWFFWFPFHEYEILIDWQPKIHDSILFLAYVTEFFAVWQKCGYLFITHRVIYTSSAFFSILTLAVSEVLNLYSLPMKLELYASFFCLTKKITDKKCSVISFFSWTKDFFTAKKSID